MKSHTSVQITKAQLKSLNACEDGLLDARKFLPATLYTDVEKNLPLALKIADTDRVANGWDDVWWLFCSVVPYTSRYEMMPDDLLLMADFRDPTIIAQCLAAIADQLAINKGK